MKLEWIGGLVVAALLFGSVALVYKIGQMDGKAEIQAKWDDAVDAYEDRIEKLNVVIAGKETEHKLLSEKNSDELARTQEEHAKALVALRTDYVERLLSSTNRASVYERLSRGTASERDRLVQHSAELDRTLEEGRSLVRELRQTLGQCEVTVGVLGTQILLDRNLLK